MARLGLGPKHARTMDCPTNVEIFGWVDVWCLDRERRRLKQEVHVNSTSSYLTVNTLTLHYKDQLILLRK